MPASSDPPLRGIRVLDLSRVLAGPYCAMMLGDMGADVIKVERPPAGDDTRRWGPPSAGEDGEDVAAYYLCANRNKRAMQADLGEAGDRDRVRMLAESADVLIENFRPGTLERWGLGHDGLAAVNPGLVTCSITGYRADSAEAGRPGYDFALQARSGWMSITGSPDGEPTKVGVAIVDVLTGQQAATSILAALHERSRSGRGQRITIALFDSALAGLVNVAQAALVTDVVPDRLGNAHPHIVPYRAFRAADRPIVVAVGNDPQWRRFCQAVERPELADDDRYRTNPDRVSNRKSLEPLLAAVLRERPATEWLNRLDDAGVPCSAVRNVREALADPVALERDEWRMTGSYGTVETVPPPAVLHRTPAALRLPAPALGEHDDEIAWADWHDKPEPEDG